MSDQPQLPLQFDPSPPSESQSPAVPVPPTLDELMARDPTLLSDDDISRVCAAFREARHKFVEAESVKASKPKSVKATPASVAASLADFGG